MASRLSRKLGEAVSVYRREPPELRAQFEHALVSTLEAFDVLGKGFSPDTGKILKEAIGQIFVDGYVGGRGRRFTPRSPRRRRRSTCG
jgi:hypothetical protein